APRAPRPAPLSPGRERWGWSRSGSCSCRRGIAHPAQLDLREDHDVTNGKANDARDPMPDTRAPDDERRVINLTPTGPNTAAETLPPTPPTFYEQVGGERTFRELVAHFYRGVAEDPVLRP